MLLGGLVVCVGGVEVGDGVWVLGDGCVELVEDELVFDLVGDYVVGE